VAASKSVDVKHRAVPPGLGDHRGAGHRRALVHHPVGVLALHVAEATDGQQGDREPDDQHDGGEQGPHEPAPAVHLRRGVSAAPSLH
jgi:hypothetical protein